MSQPVTRSTRTAMIELFRRDMMLAARNKSEWLNPPLFFIFAAILFPLAIGPNSKILTEIAPGIIWVVALLAALLSLDSMFRSDYEDGSLEQVALTPYPFSLLILTKITVHWLLTGVPLILLSPLLATFFSLDTGATLILMKTLLLGTPVLSLVGAIGSALTVGLRRGSMLISLLVLPLYVPVLIFGANAVAASTAGLDIGGHLMIIASLLVLSITLAPLAAAAALRISIG